MWHNVKRVTQLDRVQRQLHSPAVAWALAASWVGPSAASSTAQPLPSRHRGLDRQPGGAHQGSDLSACQLAVCRHAASGARRARPAESNIGRDYVAHVSDAIFVGLGLGAAALGLKFQCPARWVNLLVYETDLNLIVGREELLADSLRLGEGGGVVLLLTLAWK